MTSRLEEEKSLGWDLDEVLTDLKFSRYQLKNLILIGLLIMFTNLHPLSFTLTAADLDYRCKIPECDVDSATDYEPAWLPNAVPYKNEKPWKCIKYKSLHNIFYSNRTCSSSDTFNKNITEECSEWIFATEEVTIVNEFNIMCEKSKWELPMIGTINNLGQFFGVPIFGIISDKYGRKVVAIMCCVTSAVFGILRGLSTSYLMFATFEFLDSFFGCAVYGAVFILGIELVNPKMRPLAATIIGTFYPVGAIIMGFLAWYYQNWRKYLIACYTPGLLFTLYWWIIPESIRWLQTNGRYSEVFSVLKKVSDSNNIPLSDDVIFIKKQESFVHKTNTEEKNQPFWKPILIAFKSKSIWFRLINCSFAWFTNTLVYYGLSVNSVELVGNKFLNFILTNAVEIPAFIISGFIMNKIERRVSQSASFFLSGLACIICEFIPSNLFALEILLFLVSKFLITISFNIMYTYSAEMFPTELRLSLCGFASMFGRIGSMLAPQTVLLRDVLGKHAPVLLFGVTSLIAGALATLFPETLNKKLPDTVNQAKLVNE